MAKTGPVIGRPLFCAMGQRNLEKTYPRLLRSDQGRSLVLFDKGGREVLGPDMGVIELPLPEAMYRTGPAEKTMRLNNMESGYGVVHGRSGVGVIDTRGRIVVPMKYEGAGIPSEGLVPVKTDGGWGYIDKAGHFAIQPGFAHAKSFREGVAAAATDAGYGLIDRKGRWLVDPAYDDAGYCFNGLLPVARNYNEADKQTVRWGLVDRQGKIVLPLAYDCLEWSALGVGMKRMYGRMCWYQPDETY